MEEMDEMEEKETRLLSKGEEGLLDRSVEESSPLQEGRRRAEIRDGRERPFLFGEKPFLVFQTTI